MRALVLALCLALATPALALHQPKASAIEQTQADAPPPRVVEIRPVREPAKPASPIKDTVQAIGRSAAVMVGVQVVLAGLRVGLAVFGLGF